LGAIGHARRHTLEELGAELLAVLGHALGATGHLGAHTAQLSELVGVGELAHQFLGTLVVVEAPALEVAGGLLANALSRKPVKRWFERCIGGAFMGLAVGAALVRRT
jgi:hypothetical protein